MKNTCSVAGRRHLDAVELPSGSIVWACSFPTSGYQRTYPPDFGLYLDPRWQPPWTHAHLEWADFGLPSDRRALRSALGDVLCRASLGERVEIGCLGGHGRTGTAIACLAVLDGLSQDPVDWVRSGYCPRAVETDQQAAYARAFGLDGTGETP